MKPEFGKCYYFSYEPFSWDTANQYCKELDPDGVARLTSVRSKEENNYLFSSFGDLSWIGGSDKAEKGVFR